MTDVNYKSVLVIDDDPTVRKFISHHLNANGFRVFEAEETNQAFNHLENEKIDLVLCDITMDDMDGFNFCRKVRENQNYRALPFVFVTAKSSLEDKSTALDAGGDDFITKPFDIYELLLKVNTLIKRSDVYKEYGAKKKLKKSFTRETSRILLVDDDQTVAKFFQFNLKKEGYDCIIAHSATEGLEAAKKIKPDLIISDIMMPDVDGFEFRRMILKDELLRYIPFVFLTFKSEEQDILEGYDLEITDYIVKDLGPKIFTAKINSIIQSLSKEKDKIVSELNLATESLRSKVVPENYPQFEGFEIRHWHKPFQGIPGGDFIDYFMIDNHNMIVILGDVMGKKWDAWYFAFPYAGYIRSAIRGAFRNTTDYSPSDILQEVNKFIFQDSKVSEVFSTISILVINNVNRIVRYAGAGDLPVVFKKKSSEKAITIKSEGLLLGFEPDGKYIDQTIKMDKDDLILLTTDGIIDTVSGSGELFGLDALIKLMNNINGNQNVLDYIANALITFSSGKFEDDVSVILIKAL
jgi:phosphoserine phosphatase RsbU/P